MGEWMYRSTYSWVVSFTLCRLYAQGKSPPYTLDRRLGLDDVERRNILTLPRLELRRLGRPVRSQSLYRLSYPGSQNWYVMKWKKIWNEAVIVWSMYCPSICQAGLRKTMKVLIRIADAPEYGCRAVLRSVSADLLQMLRIPFADTSVRVRARKLAAEPRPLGHFITPWW
jgi:hypothetical protein